MYEGRRQGDPEGIEGEGAVDRSVDAQPFVSLLLEVRHAPNLCSQTRLIDQPIPIDQALPFSTVPFPSGSYASNQSQTN